MFKKDEENKTNSSKMETIIGPSIKVKGDFKGQGNTVIEGTLEGSLQTDSDVFAGDNAQIFANIKSKTARIGGVVKGNIETEKHLQIVASARISGDIYCYSLSVESGAVINGQIVMGQTGEKRKEGSSIASSQPPQEDKQ